MTVSKNSYWCLEWLSMRKYIWEHKKITNTSGPEIIVLNCRLHLADPNYIGIFPIHISKIFQQEVCFSRVQCWKYVNSNFHMIQRKTLPMNHFYPTCYFSCYIHTCSFTYCFLYYWIFQSLPTSITINTDKIWLSMGWAFWVTYKETNLGNVSSTQMEYLNNALPFYKHNVAQSILSLFDQLKSYT